MIANIVSNVVREEHRHVENVLRYRRVQFQKWMSNK